MSINPEIFSAIGYLSVILWVAAVVLAIVYWIKPSLLLCIAIFGMTIGGYVCAKINSKTYVNLIQIDQSEEIAKREAMEQARQQAMLDSRGEDVAQIRFAEDSADDFLDRAGMDEADVKYFESQGLGVPEWQKNKKKRSGGTADDDSIEAAIGGDEVIEGVESEEFEEKEAAEPILMSEVDMVMANRLDLLNIRITFYAVIIGIVLLVLDYLRRANLHGKSSFPLPFPSSWLNALTPMPGLISVKRKSESTAASELARLAKRGDSFIYLTNNSSKTADLPDALPKLPLLGRKEDLIHVTDDIDDLFIFETVWFGRSSFVVDSKKRSRQLLETFVEQLKIRKASRAKVRQTAHIVWDGSTPLAAGGKKQLKKLAEATGFSVLCIEESHPDEPSPDPAPESTAMKTNTELHNNLTT